MQDGVRATLIHVVGGLRRKDVLITDGDAASVFHRSSIEFRDENLVILAKGVSEAEIRVVEIKTLLSLGEQALSVEIFCQRRAAVQPQRDLELGCFLAFGVRY